MVVIVLCFRFTSRPLKKRFLDGKEEEDDWKTKAQAQPMDQARNGYVPKKQVRWL